MDERVKERTGILLIEDNPGDARLIREMIAEANGGAYALSCVDCLRSGLDRLGDEQYHVVLLDLQLPDSSGVDTFRKVRSRAPGLPIVVMSGLDDEDIATRTVREGSQDYLVKGQFDSQLLVRSIRYAMERKRNEQLKNNFINNASHELRTPLSILKIALSNLGKCMGNGSKDQQKKMLHMAEVNVNRLVNFINNFLDFARLEAGKMTVSFSPLNLVNVLHETVENFQIEARDHNITLEADIEHDLPEIYANESMMVRVMNNLLSNAMHYAREKISIAASVIGAGDTNTEDPISPAVDGKAVKISVIDDGEGIPEEKLKLLFSKFYQAQDVTEEHPYKGSGLGLAICKEIVNQHNGTIWAESKTGQGARFNILLPVNGTHQ